MAAAVWVFGLGAASSSALATIRVGPPIPVAAQSFSVSRAGLTFGAPINVVETTVSVEEHIIDIVTYVEHGSGSDSPVPYLSVATVAGLPAGDYLVRILRRDRGDPGSEWGPYYLLETLSISIVPPSNVVEAVEYFSVSRDHYFLTVNPIEIAALDAGALPDWVRTGLSFSVHVTTPTNPNSIQPVCRYYGLPSAGLDTHFFSAYVPECAFVLQAWPDKWVLESPNAFFAYLPINSDGECPAGTRAVFRFYNGRPDVNHRYTTSTIAAQEMISRGWIAEGWGPEHVGMCTAT